MDEVTENNESTSSDTQQIQAGEETLSSLELPDMSFKKVMGHFGPGIILMMTGIGTSHIITAPTAGGRFGYALMWCIPVAYIFKYYGFEMAFRFTNATGKSLIEAYGTQWKKWPLWYVMATTLLQCVIGQAGRLIAAAAVLYFLFSYLFSESLGFEIPIEIFALILGTLSVTILLRGNYKIVERVAKGAAGFLFVTTVYVFFVDPPPLSVTQYFVTFDMPSGSWLIIAGFLGLLPTGIDVSLQASEWGKAKKVGMGRIRHTLEEMGLAQRFDPFAPNKEHLAIDLMLQKANPEKRKLLETIINFCIIMFGFSVMVVGGTWLVYTRFALEVKSAALQLPLGYVYIVLPISGILIVFYSIDNLYKLKIDAAN